MMIFRVPDDTAEALARGFPPDIIERLDNCAFIMGGNVVYCRAKGWQRLMAIPNRRQLGRWHKENPLFLY